MAATAYTFPLPVGGLTGEKLQQEIVAAGLPLCDVYLSGNEVRIVAPDALTAEQQVTLAAVVAAHVAVVPSHKRTIYSIRASLNALSAAQKNAVWSDLSSGTPPKWALDAGPNAAAIAAIEWAATVPAGVTATEKTEARLRLAAMYCQDNPKYLVNPAFDPTINIDGTEPDA